MEIDYRLIERQIEWIFLNSLKILIAVSIVWDLVWLSRRLPSMEDGHPTIPLHNHPSIVAVTIPHANTLEKVLATSLVSNEKNGHSQAFSSSKYVSLISCEKWPSPGPLDQTPKATGTTFTKRLSLAFAFALATAPAFFREIQTSEITCESLKDS